VITIKKEKMVIRESNKCILAVLLLLLLPIMLLCSIQCIQSITLQPLQYKHTCRHPNYYRITITSSLASLLATPSLLVTRVLSALTALTAAVVAVLLNIVSQLFSFSTFNL
jgi:hypothetical protein